MIREYRFNTKNSGMVVVKSSHRENDGFVEILMTCDDAGVEYYTNTACLTTPSKMLKVLSDAGVLFADDATVRFNHFCFSEIIADEKFSFESSGTRWVKAAII